MEFNREELKAIMVEALQDEIKPFFVDREQHYQDHCFIKSFREWCNETKSTFWKAILRGVVVAAGILLISGFIYWLKTHK